MMSCSYLRINNYDELFISADKQYIKFESPSIQQYFASGYGDGIGIDLATIRSISEYTRNNDDGKSLMYSMCGKSLNIEGPFDEFLLFTNITRTYLFLYNTGVTSIKLPDSLTEIGTLSFAGTKITEIDTKNVTMITGGDAPFDNCTELKTASFPNVETMTSGFYSCKNLEEIKFNPSKLKTFTGQCFAGCNKLARVIGIENVETLGGVFPYIKTGLFGCRFYNVKNIIGHLFNETRLKYAVFAMNWFPEFSQTNIWGYNGKFNVYVRDEFIDDWKGVLMDRSVVNIKSISDFSTDFPDEDPIDLTEA